MNIRDYYLKTAKSNFWAAWILLGLAIVFFILRASGLITSNVFFVTVPFLIISTAHFFSSDVYAKRARDLEEKKIATGSLHREETVLLQFMPAPTLRLLLFEPNGALLGELRDKNMRWFMWMVPGAISVFLPKSYELVSAEGDVLAFYRVKGFFSNSMEIKNRSGTIIGYYHEKKSLVRNGCLYDSEDSEWIIIPEKNTIRDFPLKTAAGKSIAVIQTGWMPWEWQKRFEPNTPVLTFTTLAGEKERLAVWGVCALLFHHYDH
ncbi:hypothetical protein [Bacillus massiliglaciei]|uniref:hypothetical protein n=1 Tax=Bacillus massiliglaciei TaxID=1816693 RepID=UPI000AF1DCA6|nr:hypothetical protein [Bacillus massiliglaciei]